MSVLQAWWFAPTLLTVLGLLWAVWPLIRLDPWGELEAMVRMISVLFGSLLGWIIAGLCK